MNFERPEVCPNVIRFIMIYCPDSLRTSQVPKYIETELLESAPASLESFRNMEVFDDKVRQSGRSDAVDIGGRHNLMTSLD